MTDRKWEIFLKYVKIKQSSEEEQSWSTVLPDFSIQCSYSKQKIMVWHKDRHINQLNDREPRNKFMHTQSTDLQYGANNLQSFTTLFP